MRARVVAATRGAFWLLEGARIFLAAPFSWLFLIATYYFLVLLVSLLPALGLIAVALTTPAFSVGFMAVARAAANRARPDLPLLFDGFRHHARAQLVLGGCYLVFVGVLMAGITIGEGDTLRAAIEAQRAREPVADLSGVLAKLAFAAAVYGTVMTVFWFAPVLSAWHGLAPMKALFFSMVAALMNWRAFLVFGALVLAAVFAIPYLVLPLLTLLSGGALKAREPQILLPLALLLLPPLYAGFYASYRDVFGNPEPAPEPQ
jgi:hypothetical protein